MSQFLCSLCSIDEQKNFKVNFKNQKYQITLHPEEMTQFFIQNQLFYPHKKFLNLVKFLICVHQESIDVESPFYLRELEEFVKYKDFINDP